MPRFSLPRASTVLAAMLLFADASAAPLKHDYTSGDREESFLVGDRTAGETQRKVLGDTTWIADWHFEGPNGSCSPAGWTRYDGRMRNDGSVHWFVGGGYSGTGGISGQAAVLSAHEPCWSADGYGNDWDQSIILRYQGATTLSFDFLSDSEPGFDFVTVECDSAGASESRVNYALDPSASPEVYRTVLFIADGYQNSGLVSNLALVDFGTGTHEVYIRFESDVAFSSEDGRYLPAWNAGLVVDDIVVAGGLSYGEGFEGALNANVSFANTAPAMPFGLWARLYPHIRDNDKCTENPSCAWLFTDPLRLAFFPNMGFGPGGAVVRNWLDNVIVSPWTSLASSSDADATVLSFRQFPGTILSQGGIALGWRVRGRWRIPNAETPAPDDSIECVSAWANATRFTGVSIFRWLTSVEDLTPHVQSQASEIQVSFRVAEWSILGPPATLNPGPGPYLDRIRIGRRTLSGPVLDVGIDTRTQAQDCFPTVQNSIVPGEHYSPASTDLFGTCALSNGADLGSASSPNLITGDSILVGPVVDARGAGGVTSVRWFGAVTAGPHAGKAPAPYAVGANDFFEVSPDSARAPNGAAVAGTWFVDLDDTYFRGGDRLVYFWYATDAAGGGTSLPEGMTTASFPPASIAAAENATRGLYEASFLPTIDWAPGYRARIAADQHGDLEPTPAEIAGSSQRACILYYQHTTSDRRSGDANRTAFMYTLDRLGYRDAYDVYDVQGYGNTNNQLGGRADVAQCRGYALLVEDDGRSTLVPNITNGSNDDNAKVDQAGWYQQWLRQGLTGPVGIATLWILGENTAFATSGNALFTTDFSLVAVVDNQALAPQPDVAGVGSFTFSNGNVASFSGPRFALAGGCPSARGYDMASPTGTAVGTHKYMRGVTPSSGYAVVMNRNAALRWNTIWMGFGWFDIEDAFGSAPGTAPLGLARRILDAVLPAGCLRFEDPTDSGPDPEVASPRATRLHPNVPNPFNPVTRIEFDLARDGRVKLQIFDVAGRLVRTLIDERMSRGYRRGTAWNGLDERGHAMPSGVYFYRLETADFESTRKMVLLD